MLILKWKLFFWYYGKTIKIACEPNTKFTKKTRMAQNNFKDCVMFGFGLKLLQIARNNNFCASYWHKQKKWVQDG
jgi:hypothetical protein